MEAPVLDAGVFLLVSGDTQVAYLWKSTGRTCGNPQ